MAFPSIDPSNLDFTHNQPTLITRSINGYEQRAKISNPRWLINVSYNNLSESERRDFQAFFYEVDGSLSEFDFPLPGSLGDSSTLHTDALATSSSGAVGDTSISVTGTADANVLSKGDLFRFDGENKTYMATADLTLSGGGTGTLEFAPGLLTSVGSATSITYNNVNINVRLDGEDFSYATSPNFFSSFNLRMIEVL